MRDYTRKAKIKDSNEWVIGYHVYVDYLDKHYILVSEKTHDGFRGMLVMKQYEVDGDTICNPIGLTDKNGNMIWENDILTDDDMHSIVRWDDEEARFVVDDYGTKGCLMEYGFDECMGEYGVVDTYGFDDFCSMQSFEVIGNTFDHPDLLKGE